MERFPSKPVIGGLPSHIRSLQSVKPVYEFHLKASMCSFIIKVFFYCCLLHGVKILCSPLLWCNLCNSVFFSFPLCAGFSCFSEILKPVPSRWIPTCYVRFLPPSFSDNFRHASFRGNVHVLMRSQLINCKVTFCNQNLVSAPNWWTVKKGF